jgi:CheY-like chemotaxis protein
MSRIVIVEDELLIASDLQARLESAGHQVAGIADSGAPALQIIRDAMPDLVLMDIRLKGEMDGIAVAAEVRVALDIPVVFVTAWADRDTMERALAASPFGFIQKPFSTGTLHGTVDLALATHRRERTAGAPGEKSALMTAFRVLGEKINEQTDYLVALEGTTEETP